jgi:hypothetical protein
VQTFVPTAFKAPLAVGALGLAFVGAAGARDLWGCEVLMCFANPDGPTAVAQCVEPVERLRRNLRRGGEWPRCEEAESAGAGLRPGVNYYDACPSGTDALPEGVRAIARDSAQRASIAVAEVVVGIGEGEGVAPFGTDGGAQQKVCVAGASAERRHVAGLVHADGTLIDVTVYEHVVQLAPRGSARYVDVIVPNADARRVRY